MKFFNLLFLVVIITTACSLGPVEENKSQDNISKQQDEKSINIDNFKEAGIKDEQTKKEDVSLNGNKITNIKENAVLGSPLMVEGETNVSRNKLMVALANQDKEIKVEAFAIVNENEDAVNTFRSNLFFVFNGTKEGYVMIYEKDGEEKINVVEIPVKFGKTE